MESGLACEGGVEGTMVDVMVLREERDGIGELATVVLHPRKLSKSIGRERER